MIKRILTALLFLTLATSKGQCPQVFNSLGVPTFTPYWIDCAGTGTYVLNFQAPTSWGTYSLNFGDGSPIFTSVFYFANSVVSHTYVAAIPDTFIVTLNVPSLACTLTGVVVMEVPVVSNVSAPVGGINSGCAPISFGFQNLSTNVGQTSHFRYIFGDGTSSSVFTYTNAGQVTNHTYSVGSVNCQTAVTLQAWNYCSMGTTATSVYSPINIYGRDVANITPDQFVRCWPSNVFTFSNTGTQNCVPQGNNFQRQQEWNLGNYWGMPGDSILGWTPFPPAPTASVAYPAIGNYTVMLRDSNMCGRDSNVINIVILNPPTASAVAQAAPLCPNSAVGFTNASTIGFSYLWNFGDGGGFVNLGPGNPSHTYTTAGTYTVTHVAQFIPGGASCTQSFQLVVTILPAPIAGFTVSPNSACELSANFTFTDTSVGASVWAWTFGNGNISSAQNPPTQTYTLAGVYTVTLVVGGALTCSNVTTQTVLVLSTPSIGFSPTIACVNSVVNFTNLSTVTGTLPMISYTWNPGDGSANLFTQNIVHTYTAAGLYPVGLTVATASCSNTFTRNIQIVGAATPSFVFSPTTGCSPLTVNFTNLSIGATGYTWNYGTTPTNTSSLVNPSFTFTNVTLTNQTFTVTLITKNAANCVDSVKQTITVFPQPNVNFTFTPTTGCSPLSVNYTNTTTGATSYTWDFGNGTFSNTFNASSTYTLAGPGSTVFNVNLVANNAAGCPNGIVKTVTVGAPPAFTLSLLPNQGCSPLGVQFPSFSGVTSYTWNFGDGSPLVFTPAPIHVFTNTTLVNQIFTVTVTMSSALGCTASSSASITIFFQPIAGFTLNPLSGCSPLAITFTNTSAGNTNNSWDFDNGQTSSAAGPGTITFTNIPGASDSSYVIKLKISNAINCSDSTLKTITLLGRPNTSFSIDPEYCSPAKLTFTNTTFAGLTYTWNINGVNSNAASPSTVIVNPGAADITGTVSLVSSSGGGCTNAASSSFIIHPQANFNITSAPDSGCTSLRVGFSGIAGVTKYNWSFGDGGSSTLAAQSHTYYNTGNPNTMTYTATLIAYDANNCTDTVKKKIKVFPLPNASFNVSPTEVLAGSMNVNFTNLSTNGATYLWNFGDGNTSNAVSPVYVYPSSGEYTVELNVTSSHGCKDKTSFATITVDSDSELKIPNAFTPNTGASKGHHYDPNDLSNDIFHPVMKGVETFNMKIFSRWGELLYESKSVKEGWDGYYNGKLCTQDVYVWKISATFINGATFDKHGDLLLIIK
jgi:gliding motility-associated-like protein